MLFRSIYVNASCTGYIPRQKIFAAGTRLSLLFILSGMAAILLLSNLDWLARFFGLLKQGIIWLREQGVFAFLASLLAGIEEHFAEPAQERIPAGPSGMYLEPGEPGLFWQILEKILMGFMSLLLVGLLFLFLFRFVRMVLERFRRQKTIAEDAVYDDGQIGRAHV